MMRCSMLGTAPIPIWVGSPGACCAGTAAPDALVFQCLSLRLIVRGRECQDGARRAHAAGFDNGAAERLQGLNIPLL